jgi:aspartyl-tRNA(Asn)/glutamyl-tRNA(Gln) amidotransferase subunit A
MDSIFVYRNPAIDTPGEGHLQGLKIAIQPNISVAGWPTDAGSKALINFTALEDATIVQRLRQAGAYLCGSTRMSEFGFGLQNSLAGEALRQKAADAELVIDLMGESRLAASRAAVCAFKPSYGLVSRFGLVGLIPSMECCGVLSGSLKIIRDILKAVAGPDERDFSLPEEKIPDFDLQNIDLQKITIGVITEALSTLPAAQEKMFRESIEELKKAGCSLKEISLPDFDLFSLVHKVVGSVEASSSAGRYDSVRYGQRAAGAKNWNEMYLLSRGAAFGPLLKSYLFQGAFFQFERYEAYEDACRIRARLLAQMQQITSQADFLVFPTANYASFDGLAQLAETYSQFALTAFANVTGQPVLYLPDLDTARPGFQLVGPRLSDAQVLGLGEYLLNLRQGGK